VFILLLVGIVYKGRISVCNVSSVHFIGESNLVFVHHSLDAQCLPQNTTNATATREATFEHIFLQHIWSSDSRSGPGSTIHGAFDWIQHLRIFLRQYNITSVADIPCGDTFWQFAIREMNTLPKVYFGGDISSSIIQQNQQWYAGHANKLFAPWDIVRCPLPTFSTRNATHHVTSEYLQKNLTRLF
jgi:hypothetical protein